jgi:hypothetical protein
MTSPLLAITIWQPWATLIVEGCKPYEFRTWDYRGRYPRLVGGRIAIHAGRRPVDPAEVAALLARLRSRPAPDGRAMSIAVLERAPRTMPLSAVLGTAVLGIPRKISARFAASALAPDRDRLEDHLWAWPLSDIERFDVPVPARGSPGFWRWPRG